jgi:hypothetical protein
MKYESNLLMPFVAAFAYFPLSSVPLILCLSEHSYFSLFSY